MPIRQRNYAAEYAARQQRARVAGFTGYGQQRRVRAEASLLGQARLLLDTPARDRRKIVDLLSQAKKSLDDQKKAGVPERDRHIPPELKGRLWGKLKHYLDLQGCKDIMKSLY
jgi:hypothetical protein